MTTLADYREQVMAEQATGCIGAGDYRQWAAEQGYPILEVVDWTSSAGDWTFIVSKDGEVWYLMSQENNWPRRGFTRIIDTDAEFCGSAEEALDQVVARYWWNERGM